MTDLHKSDPRALRTALVMLGTVAVVGAVVITVAGEHRADFEAWVKEDLYNRLRLVTIAVILLSAGPVLGAAGYLWSLGRRVARAARYPPPGLRVIRDTPVVAGEPAQRIGRLLQVCAVVTGFAGLGLAVLLWRMVSVLPRPPA